MPFLARWIVTTPIIRPDTSYYVRVVSQFMNWLQTPHIVVVKKMLKYSWGMIEYGVHFTIEIRNEIINFTYVDWVGDVESWWSTFGYVFKFGKIQICGVQNDNLEYSSFFNKNRIPHISWRCKQSHLA